MDLQEAKTLVENSFHAEQREDNPDAVARYRNARDNHPATIRIAEIMFVLDQRERR